MPRLLASPWRVSALVNVEILCSSRELFGADRSALRLSEALISIGLSPTLLVPSHRPELGLSDAAKMRGVATREEHIAIASSSGIEAPLGLLSTRRSSDADLTIFNTSAVLGSSHRCNRKIVVIREWLDPRSPRHRLLAVRHRIGADAVVGVSTGVMRQWRSCIAGPARQYVVPNWLDRVALQESSHATAGIVRTGILCIGRFNRWKGQDALASAYEQAFSSVSQRPRLRFVGSQPGTEFDARSDALTARGERLGWEVLPFTSDPSEYFRSSALVVVPSLQPEPFGTIILEAIAYGCRVIAFDGGGPTDMAQNFPGIVKLTPRDGPGLANALGEWWDRGGPALSPEETEKARETLESHYSPEAGAASWKLALDALTL
jgi:glycosyltransferase involved in cell wall biosynthesis